MSDKVDVKATQDQLDFLDNLRTSGVTNMFGAGPYVQDQFSVTRSVAHSILADWMRTFSDRHPRG